jgi:hypothetical protein
MDYLSLSKDSFSAWCDAVGITSYKYEFSNRTYFVSGEFYALADKVEIKKIKDLHGERWSEYYSKYDDVKPYLVNWESDSTPMVNYEPKSEGVADFINSLKE